MRRLVIGILIVFAFVPLAAAADFLGATLCADSVNTSVLLPDDSPLTLLSVEVGKHGALVMLLEGKPSRVLDDVDDLMADLTGHRGTGTSQQLQWSGNSLTGFGKIIRKGNVALVVSSSDECGADPEPAATMPQIVAAEVAAPPETEPPVPAAVGVDTAPAVAPVAPTEAVESAEPEPAVPAIAGAGAATAVAMVALPTGEVQTPPAAEAAGFPLEGSLKYSPAGDGWVDVMGVVANETEDNYRLATFDVAFFDASDALICVDTISVSQLKVGRKRAFRDSIQCPDFTVDSVARTSLEFAGGY